MKPTRVRLIGAGAAIGCTIGAGCSTQRSVSMAELWAMRHAQQEEASAAQAGSASGEPARVDPETLAMFDGRTGSPVSWAEVVDRASRADVVLIGEVHSHPVGLAAAAALWDGVLARADRPALSLEFFSRDQQVGLDDFLAGVTETEAFEQATGRTEGSYPPGHRAMVEAARRAGVPVIASNAPRRYVRYGRTEGVERFDEFTGEQRRLVDPPGTTTGGRYRSDFFEMFGFTSDGQKIVTEEDEGEAPSDAMSSAHGHEMTGEQVEEFFLAQNIWDATMAGSILRGVVRGFRPVVHVVGRFHVDHEGGLVQRVRAVDPSLSIMTISMSDTDSDALADGDSGRADVVIYVGALE